MSEASGSDSESEKGASAAAVDAWVPDELREVGGGEEGPRAEGSSPQVPAETRLEASESAAASGGDAGAQLDQARADSADAVEQLLRETVDAQERGFEEAMRVLETRIDERLGETRIGSDERLDAGLESVRALIETLSERLDARAEALETAQELASGQLTEAIEKVRSAQFELVQRHRSDQAAIRSTLKDLSRRQAKEIETLRSKLESNQITSEDRLERLEKNDDAHVESLGELAESVKELPAALDNTIERIEEERETAARSVAQRLDSIDSELSGVVERLASAGKESERRQQAFERDLLEGLEGFSSRLVAQSDRLTEVDDRARERTMAVGNKLASKLKQIDQRLEALSGELGGRLGALEQGRPSVAAEGRPQQRSTGEQSTSSRAAAGPGRDAEQATQSNASEKGALDPLTASFEELTEIGLSVTQAARVVALRKAAKGPLRIDQLDEIPGIPQRMRARLLELAEQASQ